MKKLIIIPLLLIYVNVFSQGSKIAYDLQGVSPTTTDETTNLKLPLKLIFTEKFNGKNIQFTSEDGAQVLALNNAKFGSGNLTKDGETNHYVIVINEDRTLNPGEEKINTDIFILQIEQTKIRLTLREDEHSSSSIEVIKKVETYEAGYIYYDALKLTELLKGSPNNKSIAELLKAYSIDVSNVNRNPYINDVFGDYFNSRPQGGGATSLLTNLGNTDVTHVAAGLARFLAERTKEELNEVFFTKMKEQLNAYPELSTVFPQTSSILNVIETYSYASIIQVLKEAFETDMQNIPENFYNIKGLTEGDCNKIAICGNDKECKDYKNCQLRLRKLVEFFDTQDGHWVALGMYSVKEGIKSSNPADLIKSIVSSAEFSKLKTTSSKNQEYDDYNVASSIELSNFISQSLISKDDNQVWISTSQLNTLFKTKDAFKIYLGLILAKELKGDTKIDFYDSTLKLISLGKILSDNYLTYMQFEGLIKNTYSIYNTTNNAVKRIIIASEKSVEVDPQALYSYYRTLTSSLKPIVQNHLLKTLVGRDIGASYDKIEKFLNPSVDLVYHISTKRYSVAIYDASILLNSLNIVVDEKEHPVFKPVTKSFVKYGTLISTVANAQSSEEVKQALDASVLPMGSYSIKQNSRISFSINSYVGAYYSFSETNSIPERGLVAPIGFNFSQGVKKDNFFNKYLFMGGYSINLQLLDLGALVNYYLIKGDTVTVPNNFNIKLSNIFSPGISVNYNIKKTPLSLSFGTQYIPTLYKQEQINGENQLIPTNTWRWQLSLLVDIPMYNLKVWDFKK